LLDTTYVTIGYEGKYGIPVNPAYRTAYSWYNDWSSGNPTTGHHIDIWKIYNPPPSPNINNADSIINWAIRQRTPNKPYVFPNPVLSQGFLFNLDAYYCHKFVFWAFVKGGKIPVDPALEQPTPYGSIPCAPCPTNGGATIFDFVTAGHITHIGNEYNPNAIEIYHNFVPPIQIVDVYEEEGIIPKALSNGCPYVYTYDGEEFLKNNTILPFSEFSDTFLDDWYILQKSLIEDDGVYKIKIKEFEKERTYLDNVKLIAVDFNSSDISVTSDGSVLCYDEVRNPVRCVDNNGNDCLSLISYEDGIFWEGKAGDYLDITFPNHWVRLGLLTSTPKKEEGIISLKGDGIGLLNKWVFKSRGDYGLEVADISEVERDSFVTIRIYSCNNAKLDYISVVKLTDEEPLLTELDMISAYDNFKGDVKEKIVEKDGEYAIIEPMEEIEMDFSIPPNTGKTNRKFLLYTNGRYEETLPRLHLVDALDIISEYDLTNPHIRQAFNKLIEVGKGYWWIDNTTLSDTSFPVFNFLRQSIKMLSKGGVADVRINDEIFNVASLITLLQLSKDYGENLPSKIEEEIVRAYTFKKMGDYEKGIKVLGDVWNEKGKGCSLNSSVSSLWWQENEITSFSLPNIITKDVNMKLNIGSDGFYKLNCFDISGRLVKTLFEKEFNKGEYEIRLNTDGIKSGVYFFILEGGKCEQRTRITILK